MLHKRLVFIHYVFAALFLLLLIRLFNFQIIKGTVLTRAASIQRIKNFQVERDRGDILDRNGIRFTNRSTKAIVVLKSLLANTKNEEFSGVCRLLGIDPVPTRQQLSIGSEPVIIVTDRDTGNTVADMDLEGVSVIHTLRRYDEDSIATHVLGYLNSVDFAGAAGIEKHFNDVLESESKSILGAITDAKDNVIEGMGYRIIETSAGSRRLNVQTTLDYHIQKIVEDVMAENNVSGAVVVEDVNNGDIVAIASKSDFDQNRVAQYIDSPNEELFNKAVAAYNLGSVFKIIDVIAALENGIDFPRQHYCKGYIEIGDRAFKCSAYDTGGHGWVDIKSGFARSCNTYFITLGIKAGYRNLVGTAAIMGLGKVTGINRQGVSEAPGNIPLPDGYFSYGDVANISIGQGEILATPLQVADLIATVANGGIKNRVNIVSAIVDDEGKIIRNIKVNEGQRVIRKETADKVKRLLEEVIDTGTGSAVDLAGWGGAAGKTGSAETGQFVNGESVVHAWFAGYFPRRTPRYSIAVFVENGKYGGRTAAPVFEQIAREIAEKGL